MRLRTQAAMLAAASVTTACQLSGLVSSLGGHGGPGGGTLGVGNPGSQGGQPSGRGGPMSGPKA